MVQTVAEDEYDRKLFSDIESHGWHLVGISDNDDEPAYVFSIGLFETLGQPEICIFGLSDTKVMGQIINSIGDLMRAGHKFVDWHASDEVLDGYECIFRSVNRSHYQEYFGYCRWYHEGDDFPMLQCVWPDPSGHFPWHSDFDSRFLLSQPILASESPWPFREAKNAAVVTTTNVTNESHPILYVSHDEDGTWQFLCGPTNDPGECLLVGLSEVFENHPSIDDLADLPTGWCAEREDVSSPWRRYKNEGS